MIGALSRRFYHVSKFSFASGSNSSLLAKLRKATGYSVSNCKKALELFPADIQKAEEWLHNEAKKMGWSKWNKIQNRSAVQGIIGVHTDKNLGVMVEVNCETDFVAKNAEFQELLGHIVKGCVINEKTFIEKPHAEFQKVYLEEGDLLSIKSSDSSMQELVNAAMCKFNEKVVLKRAVLMKVSSASDCSVTGLTHPSEIQIKSPLFPHTMIGKFGTLLAYQKTDTLEDFKQLGLNLCQHIIGMNPMSIGTEDFLHLYESGKIKMKDDIAQDFPEDNVEIDSTVKEETDQDKNDETEESFKSEIKESDESRLLFQPYLLDPNLHIYDYTWKQAKILDYERFECGGENKKSEVIENVIQARA